MNPQILSVCGFFYVFELRCSVRLLYEPAAICFTKLSKG